MPARFPIAAAIALLASLAANAPPSEARTIRVDRVFEVIPRSAVENDGSVEIPLIGNQPDDPTPFSINFFGRVYSSVFLNENGVISFGAPLSAPPRQLADVFNAGVPVIVPFFADATMGGASLAASGLGFLITSGGTYQGSTDPAVRSSWQVAIFRNPGTTDFLLELNYGDVRWESGDLDGGVDGLNGIPPRVGFSDGFGRSYEIAGSGVNRVLLGLVGQDCPEGSLSVACNDYDFEFIDGLPYLNGIPLFPTQVTEPSSLALLVAALAFIAWRGRRRS